MKTLTISTLLVVAMIAARPAGAADVEPAHTCDGNVCKVDLPALPDTSPVTDDPFAQTSRPATAKAEPFLDLDPHHQPAPAVAPSLFTRPVFKWAAIVGASVATVVASALVVRSLDAQASRARGGEVEVEGIHASVVATAPAR